MTFVPKGDIIEKRFLIRQTVMDDTGITVLDVYQAGSAYTAGEFLIMDGEVSEHFMRDIPEAEVVKDMARQMAIKIAEKQRG